MTSTVKVEGLHVKSSIETRTRGGDTEPKTSNRANGKDVGSARGAERKVQGLSLIKSRPLGCSTVAAPERDRRFSETRGIAGEREDAEGGDAGMG
jgi:hypothetical protein